MNYTTPTGQGVLLTPEDVLALVRLIRAAQDAHASIEEDADHARHNQPADEAAAATDRANELRNAITAAEHALGLPPSDGWEGDRDLDGAPLRYSNRYECDRCMTFWTDAWSCQSDDDCPTCGRTCSPWESLDLMRNVMCGAPADQS